MPRMRGIQRRHFLKGAATLSAYRIAVPCLVKPKKTIAFEDVYCRRHIGPTDPGFIIV